MPTLDDPAAAARCRPGEAAAMKVRADLLAAVVGRVQSWNMPQGVAAARLGITRPRLNDLLRGKVGKFSLDALVGLAASAGMSVQFHVRDEGQA